MPVLKESDLERRFVAQAKRLGWLVLKLNVAGHRGWPDRLLVGLASVRFVELKRPGRRGVVEPIQLKVHEDLRRRGFRVTIVASEIDFDQALR